eukprot:COSAG05_NODE_145_length_16478_cov_15.287197_1_plen_82_part_00
MSASVLAAGRAFSSQRACEISSRASNRNLGAHPARSQNSDRACTQSVGFMHAQTQVRVQAKAEILRLYMRARARGSEASQF